MTLIIVDNKHEVLMLFTEIPIPIIKAFRIHSEDRLARLHREREQALRDGDEIADPDQYCENEVFDENDNLLSNHGDKGGDPDSSVRAEVKPEKSKDYSRNRQITEANNSFISRYLTFFKICSILAVCVIYFGVTYWTDFVSGKNELYASPYEINWNFYRTLQFVMCVDLLRNLLAQNWMYVNGGSPYLEPVTSKNVTDAITFFKEIDATLVFGDPIRGTLVPEGDQRALYFTSSSCVAVPGLYAPSDDCAYLFGGIVNNGIHDAVVQTSDILHSILIDIQNTNLSSATAINATFNSNSMFKAHSLEYEDLTNLLYFSASINVDEAIGAVSDLNGPRVGMLIGFIIISFFMFWLYFHPLIYDLNEEQKRTTAFLLLIPPPVMEKMRSIRSFVEKLAADNNMSAD